MGLRIASNIASLTAQRNLVTSSENASNSMQKLSSGYRINKSADDAAGLAISEKLKADVRGLYAAKRNTNDGISLVQTAEGGLNEVGNILVRLRELAVQGASDTVGDKERGFLNKEFGALKDEITRITKSTEFNGTMLIVGDQDEIEDSLKSKSNPYPLEIQVGKNYFADTDGLDKPKSVNTIRIDLQEINTTLGEKGLNLGTTAEDGAHVSSKIGSQTSMSTLDGAISKVAGFRATLGSIQSRLTSTVSNLNIAAENATAANSAIRDTDFAEETAKLAQTQILKQAGISVLSQANQAPQMALRLLGG